MESVMLRLRDRLTFLDRAWCNWVMGIVIFLNPIAMLPQLYMVLTAPAEQVAGVSIMMFLIFAAIQVSVIGSAIKALDWKLFGSMLISVVESLAIAAIIFIRS